jgi:hypothetical protein
MALGPITYWPFSSVNQSAFCWAAIVRERGELRIGGGRVADLKKSGGGIDMVQDIRRTVFYGPDLGAMHQLMACSLSRSLPARTRNTARLTKREADELHCCQC